jgi:predicted O-methyltransferase YrrM
MFNNLNNQQIQQLINGELGINVVRFMQIVESMGRNNIFVDIGVETGKSSKILLNNAIEKNNKVIGIDPIPNMDPEILKNTNYEYVNGDSVATGINRTEELKNKVSIAFVDSIHADVQVMCELKAWWPLIKEGGWVIFHDTAWGGYIHKPNHPCAGRLTGNSGRGYDVYGGVAWPTPDEAVKKFFALSDLILYDDEFIHVEHSPKDLGMSFVQKKKHKDYASQIQDWNIIEERRQYLLRSFGA